VLVIEGAIFRKGDGEFVQAARLAEADGSAGALADLMDAEGFDLAEADKQQALSLGAGRRVQKQGFAEAGLEFLRGEPRLGGLGDDVRGGEQGGLGSCVLAGCDVHGEDREQRGGVVRRIVKQQARGHILMLIDVSADTEKNGMAFQGMKFSGVGFWQWRPWLPCRLRDCAQWRACPSPVYLWLTPVHISHGRYGNKA